MKTLDRSKPLEARDISIGPILRRRELFDPAARAIATLASLAFVPIAASAGEQTAALVGTYDGHQTEVAASLELKAGGRFRYALSYGALDEQAEGKWTVSDGAVALTSDPVVPPRFVLVSQSKGAEGALKIDLDAPNGLSEQYFSALIATKDGKAQVEQFSDDGLSWSFTSDNPPIAVRVGLPVFEIASDPLKLDPSAGFLLHYRFEPNDLGKADFEATPLKVVDGDLLLDRHGLTLRFKRVKR
ncbi:MAG TPA: hypothetical protein VKS78_19090 [Roseiarcus sp.]|nr:hypothetical protein [Roseiarcus sp.]